ncbi:hypothetical protein ACFWXH_07260 [Mesorhizobium sp. NPDC059054]|uniref:hypothetical protein n=1 Tax=unclassified Mesorhizobium TaxID=325217 RepID=UPI0036B21A46
MQWHFSDRDGRWSEQTKAAMKASGAKGLDLNRNWALTHQVWSCAGCGRSKGQCFRLSKRGILLGKLEIHHDHLRDLVWPRAGELLGEDWRDRLPGTGQMLGLAREITSRFSEAMVCSECNAADGKAKRLLPEIDRRFTFTVSEIKKFAIPRAGLDHGIDVVRARSIWEEQRDGFEMRLDLLDTLIHEIGSRRISHDREGWLGIRPMQELLGSQETVLNAFYEQIRADDRRSEINGLQAEFLTRSVSLDSLRFSEPRGVLPAVAPSDEEYAAYSDPVSPKTWGAAPEDWTCTCCGRAKREIVRKAKTEKWSGGVRSLRVLVDETDLETITRRTRLFPQYRNDFWVGASHFVSVCSDCKKVNRDARQKDRTVPDGYLSLEDIQAALQEVRPHSEHLVDYALVREKMLTNRLMTLPTKPIRPINHSSGSSQS